MNMRRQIVNIISSLKIEFDILNSRSGRTHAFTGSCNRINNRVFSRYLKDPYIDCIMRKLYQKLYPQNKNIDQNELIFFENYGYDVIYLSSKREYSKGIYNSRYPSVWEYDWIIEIENNINEFSYTLRTLLDVTCNNRLAIFFSDHFNIQDGAKNFRENYWVPLKNKMENANLYAIVFPEKFESATQYLSNSYTYKWDEQISLFNLIPDET